MLDTVAEWRDHPREYGENEGMDIDSLSYRGPSPRIRGKFRRRSAGMGAVGTIPANTGKIRPTRVHRLFNRDHPREYGENDADDPAKLARVGTIPANTGKIVARDGTREVTRDHPREYGENRPNR